MTTELINKAYLHLKDAVDEIRMVGQYVFWKDEKKLRNYSSAYTRGKNKAYCKKAAHTQSEAKE
jgi:hypothetical protein